MFSYEKFLSERSFGANKPQPTEKKYQSLPARPLAPQIKQKSQAEINRENFLLHLNTRRQALQNNVKNLHELAAKYTHESALTGLSYAYQDIEDLRKVTEYLHDALDVVTVKNPTSETLADLENFLEDKDYYKKIETRVNRIIQRFPKADPTHKAEAVLVVNKIKNNHDESKSQLKNTVAAKLANETELKNTETPGTPTLLDTYF